MAAARGGAPDGESYCQTRPVTALQGRPIKQIGVAGRLAAGAVAISPVQPRLERSRWLGLALSVALGVLAPLTHWAESWDLRLLDSQFQVLARWQPPFPVDDIVIIAIDEATLATIPEPLPLAHARLGEVFTALARAGASVVALDLILPERSFDALMPGNDQRLILGILAMRSAGIVVLARGIDESGQMRKIHLPLLAATGPQGSGLAMMPVDRDGVVRRFDERLGQDGSVVETFVGTIARRLGETPVRGLINFSQFAGFPTVPLHRVLSSIAAGDTAMLAREFRGKIVFVGTTLPFLDQHRVPTPIGEAMNFGTVPGVAIHAQALRAVLAHQLIQPVPGWVMGLTGGSLCGLTWLVASTALRAWSAALLAGAALTLASIVLLTRGLELPAAGLALVAAMTAAVRLGLETAEEIRVRRRLRHTFAGYVSPAVLAELEAGKLEGMASERRFVCVMFLDIRGFTTRSETSPPEVVTTVLNALFEVATEVIHRHGGTVKEFMGDGVLAFFGAPQELDDPEQASFAAAQDILAALPGINTKLEQSGQAPLAIGIGMASGDAVVGHIGAAARHTYGAVGDCVNLASRLEGLSKDVGYPLVLSGELRAQLGVNERIVSLGMSVIKGHSAVEVFGWR
jgi:adenylate cyclase